MATAIRSKTVDNTTIMMEVTIVCLVPPIALSAHRPLNVVHVKVLINLTNHLQEAVHAEIYNISGLRTSYAILVTVVLAAICVEMVMGIALAVSKIGPCITDNVHATHQIFFCQTNA
jgi:hypothetical protein